ncbi:MAG: adenylyltransferase/cytidyltransferase family protein [Candidatus Moraniibacteriota bacterium]
MKKVMAFGTFDIFHDGHKSYLEQAKKMGDFLVVVIARDETVLRIKSQWTQNSEEERLEVVEKSGLADEVILGGAEDRYMVIERYRPDVIALGYDQSVDLPELTEKLKNLKLQAEIVRMQGYRPEKFKSSKLRK